MKPEHSELIKEIFDINYNLWTAGTIRATREDFEKLIAFIEAEKDKRFAELALQLEESSRKLWSVQINSAQDAVVIGQQTRKIAELERENAALKDALINVLDGLYFNVSYMAANLDLEQTSHITVNNHYQHVLSVVADLLVLIEKALPEGEAGRIYRIADCSDLFSLMHSIWPVPVDDGIPLFDDKEPIKTQKLSERVTDEMIKSLAENIHRDVVYGGDFNDILCILNDWRKELEQ